MQMFDAAIILASFTLDLIFVEGITGVQGEETLAFIIIFLLWRVLRVINGTLCGMLLGGIMIRRRAGMKQQSRPLQNTVHTQMPLLPSCIVWYQFFYHGRAYATVLRLSSVTLCILAKRCVLEQKLLLTACIKSYMRNRLVPK